MAKKKTKKKQFVLSANPGIDPVLWFKSIGHDVKLCAARNNSTYLTDNPSIHIRIRMQGKNFDFFFCIVDVACSVYLYLVLR